MSYSENEKTILGINTIWILQPLLNSTTVNNNLYCHTILVIIFSLIFWKDYNNKIKYVMDVIISTTFILHILSYNNYNYIFHTIIFLYFTMVLEKQYALIAHLLFRLTICYMFCLEFNNYSVKDTMNNISFYFIYTFYLLSKNTILNYYYCSIELFLIILCKNEIKYIIY